MNTVKTLTAKLEDLSTCADLIGKHSSALSASLGTLKLDRLVGAAAEQSPLPAEERAAAKEVVKTVNERAALLKLTSGAMVKAAADFVHTCKTDGKRWTKIMDNEREIRQKFEDMVEQYAQQHSSLEAQMRKEYHLQDPSSTEKKAPSSSTPADAAAASSAATGGASFSLATAGASATDGTADEAKKGGVAASSKAAAAAQSAADATSDSDDDDFHDAMDDEDEVFTISAPPCYSSPDLSSKKSETGSKEDEASDEEDFHGGNQIQVKVSWYIVVRVFF